MLRLSFSPCKKNISFFVLAIYFVFKKVLGPIETANCHSDADMAHSDADVAHTDVASRRHHSNNW